MIVPQHIWNYIQRMEEELQRRYEETQNVEIQEALEDIKAKKDLLEFRQELSEKEICRSEELKYTAFSMLSVLQKIYLKGRYLIYPGLSKVSCEVFIEPELIMTLNKTKLQFQDKQLQKEAKHIKQFLSMGTPNEAWTPYDETADYRIFKYVSTIRKWRYLLKKNPEVYNMTYDFKRIKIACLITEIYLSERLHFLGFNDTRGVWNCLDDDAFKAVAKKWLRTGITCTYYIYVPE